MKSDRTPEQWAAVRAEAQRRVRAGEVGAQAAKALGVHISTFQHWQAQAGRTAMGEAVRLHEAGDVAAAERTARLAEQFLRMQARIEGKLDRSTKAQRLAFERAEKDKLMNDPANPDRTHRDRVAANLDRLIERLERQQRERQEAEAAAAGVLSGAAEPA